MANFDFGQVNGKRFSSNNSWVGNPDAWDISRSLIKPAQSIPPPIPKQNILQKIGSGVKDYATNPRKLFGEIGLGLSQGLAKTGLMDQDEKASKIMLNNPLTSKYAQSQLQSIAQQRDYLKANPVTTIPGMLGKEIPQIPLWIAGGGVVNALGKGIGKLAPSTIPLAEKVGSKVPAWIKGGAKDAGAYATTVAPVDSINSGDNFSQFLDKEKQVPAIFLGGAAFRGIGVGANKGVEATRGLLKPLGVPPSPFGPPRNLASTTPTPTPSNTLTPFRQPSEVSRTASVQQLGGPLNRFQIKPDQRAQGTSIPRTAGNKIDVNDPNPIPNAETGKPFNATMYRGEISGRRDPAKGTFYTQDKEYASIYANAGDGTGKIGRVVTDNVVSNNPLVSLSKRGILEEWSKLGDETATKLLRAKDIDFGNPIVERYIAKKARELGHDSIVLKNMMEVVQLDRPLRNKSILPPNANPQANGPLNRLQSSQSVVNKPLPRATTSAEPTIPRERQFAQNVRDSQVAPEGVKQNTLDNPLTYEPITNKETLAKANLEVSTDAVKARAKFDAPSKGISADDVALGESLIVKAIKDGDTAGANVLIADLAEKLTTAGQAVQAAKMFKRLTPEGMLLYAQRVVNSTNKDLLSRLGPKAPKVELTPEDSTFIIETMRRIQTLPDGDAKRVAMAQIEKLIKDKVPATLTEKILAIQRISLLLNPKTMGRNVIGNTLFGVVDNVANVVATPIDKLTSKLFKTDRTTTIPSLRGQLKSAKEGLKITARDAKMGIDTYHNNTQYEFSGKKIFTGKDALNKTLDKLDRATIGGLKLGDTPFHKAAYDDSLRQQMKLAGVTKATPAMEEQASQVALQRTYQDVNAWTEGFKLAQKALNGGKSLGLGNIVLPFVKTPANILARAMEYSPVGLQRAFREALNIKKGTFNQKAFVDSISRSIVGTAIIKVGYDLAEQGKITGGGNKDKDVAAFERGLGKNDFAWKVGDKYYTYEWAQPASMSLAVGADMYLKGKDKKDVENVIANAIKSGGETLFKQSVMQGLQRFMGGYDPIDNIARTGINAPTQLIPTLSNQLGQISDPTQRSTYDPTNIGTGKNLLKARIPGLNKTLEPKIDTSGETVQRNQGNNNLLNVFVNPGTVTKFKPNDVQKEILRLYNATGEKDIFPRVAPKTLVHKGESIRLTPKEMTSFQQTAGKTTQTRMKAIMDYDSGSRNDAKRAEEFKKAIEKAYDDARIELLKNRGIQIK